jgi:hypothetical protein
MEGDLKRVTEMTDGVVMEARDLNEVDDMGWTALMWAISQQHSGTPLTTASGMCAISQHHSGKVGHQPAAVMWAISQHHSGMCAISQQHSGKVCTQWVITSSSFVRQQPASLR